MKTIAVFGLAVSLIATGFAIQKLAFNFRDPKGNLVIRGTDGHYSLGLNGEVTVTVTGGGLSDATAASRNQGLSIRAKRSARVKAIPNKLNKKQFDIKDVLALGDVVLTKTPTNLVQLQTTKITGSKLHYVSQDVEGVVTLDGPVAIVNTDLNQRRVLTATGNEGTANLDPDLSAKGSGLRKARLEGDVKVVVVQARTPDQTSDTTYTATGDILVVDYTVTPATITLLGQLKIFGSSDGGTGDVQGATKAVLTLNKKGEMTQADLSSDTPLPIVTRYRPKKKVGSS